MSITNAIVNYRRFLKRRNYSPWTVKNYLNSLKQFVVWVDVAIEQICHQKVTEYIDYLLEKGLKARTINLHLARIRVFYDYLYHEEEIKIVNPVKKGSKLRLSKPLPKHLRDEEVKALFDMIKKPRDRAIFTVMLRCGLRVEEVSDLTPGDIDLKRQRIHVRNGKGNKGRIVYISQDTHNALVKYLRLRPQSRAKRVFLVEKGTCRGKPISVRGIQKRIEYYARKTRLKVSCHHLRHTMATQLLNADAEIATIQDLLGHNWITTTERYMTVSNLKVERDYYRAMAKVLNKARA
ncbi:MAG: tyrosine-type recombinase/integrase [Proteobacteria bacterium]|nr:tyrosine-type recombinase/integrase [Pseudomonadota bacterium]